MKNPALVTDICHLLQPDDSCSSSSSRAAHLISRKLEIGENVICVEEDPYCDADSSRRFLHTVRNLHFLSKKSTMISRENCRFFWGEKLVKMFLVLDFLAVDNFDFTRKIVKKNLGEKLVKMLGFCQN